MNSKNILIIILSISTLVLGILYHNSLKLNENLMESKSFNFEWSQEGEILYSFWKNNSKISNEYIDKNLDNNYELINTYDIYGNIYISNYDLNENGIFEKSFTFNSYGKIIGNCIDKNEDGAIDEFTLILENQNELKFIDSNDNGQYEKIILFNKKENIKTEKLINELFEQNSPNIEI